jgi:hypothetical protein
MGKPSQRALDILGLQHQSGRCGRRASRSASKKAIADGARAASGGPFDSTISENRSTLLREPVSETQDDRGGKTTSSWCAIDQLIDRPGASLACSERFRHEAADLTRCGNERSHRHRIRRDWLLGRRVVRHLRASNFSVRIASRHPDRGYRLFGSDDPQLQSVQADIQDEQSVMAALAGAYGVVNAVSLYVERRLETFHSVHVESARRVAARARRAGVERLVHLSGVGADAASPSRYIRRRGEGELAVRAAFDDAFVVRPGGDVRTG